MSTDELTLDDFKVDKAGSPCKVGKILLQLSETERSAVEAALSGPMKMYPHTKIAAALSRRAEYVSDNVVRLHRSGTCACVR